MERPDKRNIKRSSDTSMIVAVVVLLCIGLVMIYSTSSFEAATEFHDSSFYLKKQLRNMLIGIVGMFIAARIDYHVWRKWIPVIYFGAFVMLLLVLTPLGIEANGAKRWVGVGSVSMQPAELAKIAVILFVAIIISERPRFSRSLKGTFSLAIYVGIIVGEVLIITKNLSSAIIIAGIAYIVMAVTSNKTRWFVAFAVVVAILGALFLTLFGGFRMQRVLVWQNPEAYSSEGGYQVLQSLYALGSGGIFGKGLGQSVQKLGFVPEAQNDMIFSIICEELGIFGGIAIIVLFGFLIWRIYVISVKADDMLGSLIALGVMTHISLQVILNIAVVTNTIPNTGVTLPFISYGGTSIIFTLAEMGMVLSVSKGGRARKKVRVHEET